MLFNSLTFCAFFAFTYGAYLVLMRHHRAQNVLLLIASYVFYGWWDWRFLGLIAISTTVDYAIGLAIGRLDAADDPATASRRKRLVTLSIVANLGILGCFKYFDFFADSAVDVLNALGFEADHLTLEIILPVGISFYTFQTLSYTIDVYRGRLKPERSLLNFALFVAFFPQLVAGPIERAARLLPQIAARRAITPERIYSGLFLILWGYCEKVVVADNVGMIADEIFNNYQRYHGIDIAIGIVAFSLQIFGDFSGYSNIARGLARIMGFDLMVNFRLPFFASSPADFWHRWHISLSTWLRDYLYIPLGGNRGGEWRTRRNLMLTMLLGGLWHGAAWNFVIWGGYHGLGLVVHRAYAGSRAGRSRSPAAAAILHGGKILAMFVFTLGGWLLFRAESVDQVIGMTASLGPSLSGTSLDMASRLAFYAFPLLAVQLWQQLSRNLLAPVNLPAPAAGLVLASFAGLLAVLGTRTPLEFIYFQF